VKRSVETPSRKREPSILPIRFVGVMLIDEPGVPSNGIPTRLALTRDGIELERGWPRDRQKIIARLKTAIAILEAEQEETTSVLN
jgi:hypothetical protein